MLQSYNVEHFAMKRRGVIEALDDIDNFISRVEARMEEIPGVQYTYNIKIRPIKEPGFNWLIELTLKTNLAQLGI